MDAGAGDHVLVVDEGNAAGQVLELDQPPIRTVIVGVVGLVDNDTGRRLSTFIEETGKIERDVGVAERLKTLYHIAAERFLDQTRHIFRQNLFQ